ncbi:MAG: transcription antitermination factor NusB [Erysipelotrichaceae bacterium]
MKRKELRQNIMVVLYQYQLLQNDIDTLIENTFDLELEAVDSFAKAVIYNACENQQRYATYINEELVEWTFERLGYVEQAILLAACAEFDLKTTQAAIIINEAVELSKLYCDDTAFKLINGVLDRL